jgi:DNA primase
MSKISQKTIDLIKDTADIVDVVSEFVPLQAAGKNMKGNCPFHNEKTPSFFVSKERQLFNCFGCGEKGNSISFIQKYKKISFVEALQFLADKYHIPIETDDSFQRIDLSKNLYKANDQALKFYNLNLLNLESGKLALNYLNKRGLDLNTIEEFELGYAPNNRTALFSQLSKEFQPLDLINAGLINTGDNDDYYDLFRDRIIFPIKDEANRVIAFSGRAFGDNSNPAKYVNTPYTTLFKKGTILYNLAKAAPYIKTTNRMVLMEGYMDVIKASINGVKEAVCSMGTQLTIDQALKIKDYTDNVLICYDGDRAGREATFKSLKLLERARLNVKIVLMPEGLDPDEYMTKYSDFKYQVENNQIDQYDFVYKMITENKDLTQPQEMEGCKNRLYDFFKATSGMIREIYLQKFANDTQVSFEIIQKDYQQYLFDNKVMESYQKVVKNQKQIKIVKPKYQKAERAILNYYIKDAIYRDKIDDRYNLLLFKDIDIKTILVTAKELKVQMLDKPALVLLRSDLSSVYQDKLDMLLFRPDYEFSLEDFESCLRQLEIQKLDDEIEFLDRVARLALDDGDQMEYLKHYNVILTKLQKKKELEGSKNDKTANY